MKKVFILEKRFLNGNNWSAYVPVAVYSNYSSCLSDLKAYRIKYENSVIVWDFCIEDFEVLNSPTM